MDVILLEKIRKLGELGDKVNVKPGHGRNYLIPQGKAVTASSDNVAKFEARRAELESAQADVVTKATIRAEKLADLEVTVMAKAGAEGKLFGSVGTADIAAAVTAAGVAVAKQEVRLSAGPFRMLGEFTVSLHLHADVEATIKLIILPEDE